MKRILILLSLLLSLTVYGDIFSDIQNGDMGALKKYVKDGGDIDKAKQTGENLLMTSIFYNKIEMTKYLVEKGAEINIVSNTGWSPIKAAIDSNNLELAEYLIKKGANINMDYKGLITPLMLAAKKGNLAGLKLLLKHRANVDIETRHGLTAIMYVKGKDRLEMLSLLLNKGIDINKNYGNPGINLMLLFSMAGDSKVINYLIANGGDPNLATPKLGITPLMGAVAMNKFETVKILIEAGAKKDAIDKKGRKVIDLVKKKTDKRIIDLIK